MPEEHDPIEEEELAEVNGEPLPDREVMSTIDPGGGPSFGLGPPDLGDPGPTLPVEPPTVE
jgi:hypothetical protein